MDYCLANASNSECSSGCESGWTSYLDNSFVSPYEKSKGNGNFVGGKCGFSEKKRSQEEEEEEEEDLSMVSDASSGPPHIPEEEEEEYFTNIDNTGRRFYHNHAPLDATFCKNSSGKRQKFKENYCRKKKVHHEKPSLLDDTASSPAFDFDLPNKKFTLANNHASAETVLDFSQGYSTTHFEEESSAYHQDQYSFFHSLSGNSLQENQWCGGRRWQQ